MCMMLRADLKKYNPEDLDSFLVSCLALIPHSGLVELIIKMGAFITFIQMISRDGLCWDGNTYVRKVVAPLLFHVEPLLIIHF